MQLDLTVEDPGWGDISPLVSRAVAATLDHLGIDAEQAEVSVLACDDARIAALNAEFRGKPAPTNVLSWPAADLGAERPGATPAQPAPDFSGALPLGDIAIAWETCRREAEAAGKPHDDHVTHLLVHGLLHLLGYDHVRDADATLMEGLEAAILGKMGIPDPYRD
ncbi:probable rRNA maturation factor [Cribrihabitans marinus]|uniref:Endoribonuclease YbeY n=1 Tax=Cribrihabitans marinus TaxID=1227549 RepID=A0A1H6SQH1_9RHOB|nr:rRNA maturation RNase YbeY [Cribrihabitans marinus]GGH23521.1 endoribonuclease YbeY [Cribrihabitans marinus]SEI66290.1 probable rRNA maturation factor [Cribrihabitans marinus]